MTRFFCCQTVVGLLWGVHADERTGPLFTIAAGPRHRSYSHVRDPWNSRPYFTVSDSRLPVSSPPTTRRATVEIFDPASTWHRSSLLQFNCFRGNMFVCQAVIQQRLPCICLFRGRRLTAGVFIESLLSNGSTCCNKYAVSDWRPARSSCERGKWGDLDVRDDLIILRLLTSGHCPSASSFSISNAYMRPDSVSVLW
jgi:hypothetical protein